MRCHNASHCVIRSLQIGLTWAVGVDDEGGTLRAELAQQVGGILEVGSQGVEEDRAEQGLPAQPRVLHGAQGVRGCITPP